MRIFALLTDGLGAHGGIAQYNRDLLNALSASDLVSDIVVLPRNAGTNFEPAPKKVSQLRPRPGRISYSVEAVKAARAYGPFDVIFCGHCYQAPLAAAIGRWTGAPVWLQAYGIEAWDRPSALTRASVERASLVTAISRYTRRRLLEWADLPAENVRVLPITVRPMFTPGPADPKVPAKYGLTNQRFILTVSRIAKSEAYKGHDRVIEAMARVLEAAPDAVYVIAGDGDGRAELEALVQRKGLDGAVRFLSRIPDDEVLALYRSANAFVMASSGEGFGIVFVEAAATGLPVIGGNSDGSLDALADGVIGRAVDPLDVSQIAAALIATLENPRLDAAVRAQRFAFSNFSAHVDALLRTTFH